jgi:NADH-ubiquinone oxidoreductase chain 3
MTNLTNAYQEKDSVFECGFHSFLGQNRTQFSVSFFIFGLLFLLFDLEILLVYPYSVSSYTNDIYGLVIMMVFFVLLTLGFIFELGKNALTIDSRQTSSYSNGDLSTAYAFLSADPTCLADVLTSLNSMLPQFGDFISRFNSTVIGSGVNVITDASGAMSIDVTSNLPQDKCDHIAKSIRVLDSLIRTTDQNIHELLDHGRRFENQLRSQNSGYVSELTAKLQEYNRLRASYNH